MDELSYNLYVRRTAAHDHLVLQKPRDELIERITWPLDGPAALQVPVIPWHDEWISATVTRPKGIVYGELFFSLKAFFRLFTRSFINVVHPHARTSDRSPSVFPSIRSLDVSEIPFSNLRSVLSARAKWWLIATVADHPHRAAIRNVTRVVRCFGGACSVHQPATEVARWIRAIERALGSTRLGR